MLNFNLVALMAAMSPLTPQERICTLRSLGCTSPIITMGNALTMLSR